ncbi:MAG: S8 family serine peptidase [Pyrinomonadaceae bacterium]|nr:S8 family serine peptidase [Pyrinomonadaceae bacterium]
MKLLSSKRVALSLLLMLALMQLGGDSGSTQSLTVQGDYAPGELLVKVHGDNSNPREKLARVGLETLASFSTLGWQRVRLPPGMTVEEGLARYRGFSGIERVQPNFIYRTQATPNDPRFLNNELYGLTRIQAPVAWDTSTGNASVVVAVIDLGADYNHEDLSANMWRNPGETGLDSGGQNKATNAVDDDGNGYVDDVFGVDTINHDSNPLDDGGHGTHVAGTIGATGNNGVGVVGVNWSVRIMAIKSHGADGNGTSASVVEAFQYAAMMRRRGINVRVTNNSWGGAPEAANYDQALKDAIDAAGNAGILNVCAAGNSGRDNDAMPFYPASYESPSIIAVAASDQNDNRAGFSSTGATSVDLAAPGVSILSTFPGSYVSLSGTSMATPHVSGAAALLWAHAPYLTVSQVKESLTNSVDVLPQWAGLTVTGGRLNLARAVQNVPAANAIDGPDFFVRRHYLDFLSREPDPAGQAFWVNQITQCGLNAGCIEIKRINVSAAFFLSIEFQQTGYLVYRTYKAAYGNMPGAPVPLTLQEFLPDTQAIGQGVQVGIGDWQTLLENNKNAFSGEFVTRTRFTIAFPSGMTAAQFVDTLNTNSGGALSPTEREQLVNDLSSGAKTRGQVLRAVAEDQTLTQAEFNKAFVLMQYFGYLRRNPNQVPDTDFTGYNFWLAKLNQFNGNFIDAEMVKAFLSSTEYRQRFGSL